MMLRLARKSLWDRKVSVTLTMLIIIISVTLLLSVEQIRQQTRSSFNRGISGVELIVGARTSPLNLLLASVFRIGDLSNGMSWASYQKLTSLPNVSWTIPMVFGDSHQGFAVVGTNHNYFDHFHYGKNQSLSFVQGRPFSQPYEVVLGSQVAKTLHYQIGDTIEMSHGTAKVSFSHHRGHEFTIIGILEPTYTALDNNLHIDLNDIANLHNSGQADSSLSTGQQNRPSISAVLLGLESPIAVLSTQRFINQYDFEALSAIIPGVALNQLWAVVGNFEKVLVLISVLVLVSALLSSAIMLLSSIKQRSHEIKVLRIVGATPMFIFMLIQLEAWVIVASGSLIALCGMALMSAGVSEWLHLHYGIMIQLHVFSWRTLELLAWVVLATCIAACLPAFSAYRVAR